MPTVQQGPTGKGVRRPFGNINVNRADTTILSSVAGTTAKLAVVKPTPTPQKQQVNRSASADPITCPTIADPVEGNKVKRKESESSVESVETREEAPSVFRDNGGEERTKEWKDVLSLKLANPVSEEDTAGDNSVEDRDLYCSPFSRDDNTAIVEPLDTLQLRGVFRKPLSSASFDWDERFTLMRANPIFDDDERDDTIGETYSDATQTLYMHTLLSEGGLIVDMLSSKTD